MYMRRVIRLAVLFIVLIAVLTPSITQPQPAEAQGNVLRYALGRDPISLDPIDPGFPSMASYTVANQIYEGLVALDNGNVIPAGASQWAISGGGTVYTFTIRPGTTWSDTTPVTAQHYADGLNRLMPSIWGYQLSPVKDIEVVDDDTLTITLHSASPHFLQALASFVMFPVRLDLTDAQRPFVSNGPYRIDEWVTDVYLSLVKNDSYWNEAAVQIEEVYLPIIPDLTNQMNGYRDGELDVAGFPVGEYDNLLSDPLLAPDVREISFPGFYYLGLNHYNAPIDNLDLRKALALAINRGEVISATGTDPWRQELFGVIPPGLPAFLPGQYVGYSFDSPAAKISLAKYLNVGGVTISGGPIASLGAGASDNSTFTGSYTITQTDIDAGSFVNTATVTGTPPSGPDVTDSDSETVALAGAPEITLTKTGTLNDDDGTPGVSAGDTISYAFTVVNSGNVTLTNITLADTVGGVTISGGPIASLGAGASDNSTFTGSYTITQTDIDAGSFANTATVTGKPPSGPDVTDPDSETVALIAGPVALPTPVGAPEITLTKTGTLNDDDGTPGVSAGDTISYAFTVVNSGNVTLTNITLADTGGKASDITLELWSYNSQVASVIETQWETTLGININVVSLSRDVMLSQLDKCHLNSTDPICTYHIFYLGWGMDYFDEWNILNDLFHPDSSGNHTYWDSTDYIDLLIDAALAPDKPTRIDYYRQAEEILVETDPAVIPLMDIDRVVLIKSYIDYVYSPTVALPQFMYWTINPLVVRNTADDGSGSLRHAIVEANLQAGLDVIRFNIPGAGPHVISPISQLPTITDPVIIDGYTQYGSSPNTNPEGQGLNTSLGVVLDGSAAGPVFGGLHISADDSVIRGLAIHSFDGNGIVLSGGTNTVIEGSFIGTDVSGTISLGNSAAGIALFDAPNNTVGYIEASGRNLISGNGGSGVLLEGPNTSGNYILGNFIGSDISGTIALGNGDDGLAITYHASSNTVGGSHPGAGNVISGNANAGLSIGSVGTRQNIVQGNFLGTDATGTLPLGNEFTGVVIGSGASENTIGGTQSGEGNVISANGAAGVVLDGPGVAWNVVAGNLIGTDISGTYPLPNTPAGVWIVDGANKNTIGGITPEARNIISGNNGYGIAILSEEPDFIAPEDNRIIGNYIGTDETGYFPLNNAIHGVHIVDSNGTILGGGNPGEGNLISSNSVTGVWIEDSSDTKVQGNTIGLAVDRITALPNLVNGITIRNAVDSLIGGHGTGEGNVISGYTKGVLIEGDEAFGNQLIANFIGDKPQLISRSWFDPIEGSLSEDWSWIREDLTHWSLSDRPDWLRVVTQQGGVLGTSNNAKNILVRSVPDADFLIATRVEFYPSENYQFAGLIVYQDDDNFLAFGRAYCDLPDICVGDGIYFDHEEEGVGDAQNFTTDINPSGSFSLRLRRHGDQYHASISEDGQHWIYIGSHTFDSSRAPIRVGFIAEDSDTGAAEITADFKWFALRVSESASFPGYVEWPHAYHGVWIRNGHSNLIEDNEITGVQGNGVQIEGALAVGNTITENSITKNEAKGIENLAGGNIDLQPPVFGEMLGDFLEGNAPPNSTIEIFADINGEGRVFLGSTSSDGNGYFSYVGPFEGPNLTATATDGSGNTSEFSQPVFWAPDTCEFNETFEEACDVAGELGFSLSNSGSFASYISRPDDVDWFYFDLLGSVTPGDQITISLSGLDETELPANYDLVVLAELTVDLATGATPLQGVPLQGVPLQGVPLQGVPLQGVPLQGVPLQGVPLQGVTVEEIPLQGVPLQGVPLQGVPLQGVPLQGVPLQGVPLQGVPLQGVGFHQGTAPEVISTLYRGGMTGRFYVLVWSSTGEFGITPETSQYEVKVVTHPVVVDACTTGLNRNLLGDPYEGPLTEPEDPRTLILVHRPRMVALYGLDETNDLISTLDGELLDHPLVDGVIVDLGDPSFYVGEVAAQALVDAYVEWDQLGCQAETANLVTLEIKKTINQILDQHESIENIVIVGADKIIPHRRVPDGVVRTEESATVPNEYDYQFQSAEDGYLMGNIAVRKNPLHATLRLQYYLSDDFYADLAPILLQHGHELSVPDLPIGRLVETPEDMIAYIDIFLTQDGLMGDEGVSLSSISTGYEFLDDQAAAISEVFDLKGFTPNPALTEDWDSEAFLGAYKPPQSDVRDIASLSAHFDHWRMATADGSIITSTDLGPLASESQARLIFSVGCHAGFNFPDEDALFVAEPGQLDHAQELTAAGATLIGNWGFGYGDDAALAYSEELMLNFARYLGNGTLGQALTRAKREYILNQAVLDPVHEKVLMEAIYYGLPMWQLSAEIVEIDDGFIADSTPDTRYGLDVRDYVLNVNTTFMQEVEILGQGSYYALSGQTQAALFRPIQPKGSIDISGVPDQVAHGVLFTDGAYNDILDFDPILTMPVWTQSVPELHFIFEGWDPARFWSLAQLERADGSFDEKLVIVPGQFNVDEDETIWTDETVGTERIYESLSFEIFYGSATSEFQPPTIGLVQASLGDNQSILFKVAVEDPPDLQGQSSGIVRVSVVYTPEIGGSEWESIDLAHNPSSGKWEGSIDIAEPIDFFIQAVDGAGNTGMFAGNGYFTPTAVEAQGPSEMPMGEEVIFTTTFGPEFEDPQILWDFGDGSVSEGSDTVSHAFSQPGEYEVVVRVVDSEGNIGEATIPVQVDPAITTLTGLVDGLASLPVDALRSGNEDYRETLLEKALETSSMISRGEIKGAIQKLKKDIRAKMDGCPTEPDANDWVIDCTWQHELRVLIDDLIGSLEEFLASG